MRVAPFSHDRRFFPPIYTTYGTLAFLLYVFFLTISFECGLVNILSPKNDGHFLPPKFRGLVPKTLLSYFLIVFCFLCLWTIRANFVYKWVHILLARAGWQTRHQSSERSIFIFMSEPVAVKCMWVYNGFRWLVPLRSLAQRYAECEKRGSQVRMSFCR